MKNSVVERIEENYSSMTKTFRKIANYILSNIDTLPYETAETIAQKVGVSGISVGRFLRSNGYQNIDQFKTAFRKADNSPWKVTDRFEAYKSQDKNINSYLEQETTLIQHVYELTKNPNFHNMLERLNSSDAVYIVGIQSMSGIMQYFSDLLGYMRPNIHYVTEHSGFFLEVFNHNYQNPHIVLCDIRRYASTTQKLCELAKKQEISFTFITDEFCEWSRKLKNETLILKTSTGQFWDSTTPIVSLINLTLTLLAEKLDIKLENRLKHIRWLQSEFGQFHE